MTEPRVFVLTLRSPWAWAVLFGGKDVENRHYQPGGPFLLLVHQGLKQDPDGDRLLRRLGLQAGELTPGAIVGAVSVTGWQDRSRSRWAQRGLWHWSLEDPVIATRPMLYRGRPGLFHPPEDWHEAFATRRKK